MTAALDHRLGRMHGIDDLRRNSVEEFVDSYVPEGGASAYDSAVVAGNGIGALTFAARLARHPRFAGKVTVVAPPMDDTRRLLNGVSLRGRAADFLAAALDVTHVDLLESIADCSQGQPVAYRQTTAMAECAADGTVGFSKPATWHGGIGGTREPIVYGTRNSQVTKGMVDLMANLDIEFVDQRVESADHMRGLARGRRPLVVNGTTNPRLLGARASKPKRLVLATQVAFGVKPGGIEKPLDPATAFAPLFHRAGIIDVGYFTPFADPKSPRSAWYGILARVVDADSGFDKEHELATMERELFAVGDACGLVPDDPEETLGRALVPASSFGRVPASAGGTLELRRAYSGGAPCYYADGMVSSAIGGVVAADAVASGANADVAVRRALRPWRRHNFLWWVETTRIPAVADRLLRFNGRLAMSYPHTAGLSMWASAA